MVNIFTVVLFHFLANHCRLPRLIHFSIHQLFYFNVCYFLEYPIKTVINYINVSVALLFSKVASSSSCNPCLAQRLLQILAGIYPIAQVREPYTPVGFLAQRIDLPSILKLRHPDAVQGETEAAPPAWTAYDICEGALYCTIHVALASLVVVNVTS